MAKKALSTRRRASRSSRSAATPAASAAAVRTRSTASSACAGSASARWRTRRAPRHHQEQLVTPFLTPTDPDKHAEVPGNHGEKGPHAMTDHDDDRPDRRHAHPSAQRQLGVPRDAWPCRTSKIKTHIAEILQQQGYIAGWHVDDPRSDRGRQDPRARPEVRPQPRALDRRRPPHLQARSAGLRQVDGHAARPRRARRRDHLDVVRPADRPAGHQEGRRWGSPRLRLVGEGAGHVTHRTACRSPSPPASTSRSTASAVTVKGPKGTLTHTVAEPIDDRARRRRHARRHAPERRAREPSLHGLTRTLVANMVTGVTDGYEKKLEIVGVGYRVAAKGSDLEFALGFSHPVLVAGARGHHLRRRDAHQVLGRRHRQAAGRRGRRQHPQAPQARPVQGQGRPLRGRGHPPQGRKGG